MPEMQKLFPLPIEEIWTQPPEKVKKYTYILKEKEWNFSGNGRTRFGRAFIRRWSPEAIRWGVTAGFLVFWAANLNLITVYNHISSQFKK